MQVVFCLDQKLGILLHQVDLDEVSLQKVLRDAADAGPAVEGSLVSGPASHLKIQEAKSLNSSTPSLAILLLKRISSQLTLI